MKKRNLYDFLHPRSIVAFTISLSIICFCGCDQSGQRTFSGSRTPGIGHITREQLRENLDALEEFFRFSVNETSYKIETLDSTAKMRKTNLFFKTRAFQTINAMLEYEDPVIAFIETWGFSVRLRQYLEEGEGSSLFANNQPLYVDMTAQFEAKIESVGKTFMGEDVFDETRKRIYSFARSNPIKSFFTNAIVYATRVEPGKPSPFEDVLGIPLSPITAMKGVDRTATSINRFTDTAARFSDIVEELPESVHWQLLALLYDFEETEMTTSFLSNMSSFSKSSKEIAEATKTLPQDIREQISLLFEEVEESQANLQATLDKIQTALATADKTAVSFKATAIDVSKAATAWENAASSTQNVLSEFGRIKSTPTNRQEGPAYTIEDMRSLLETLNQTVSEINTLVNSDHLADYTSIPDKLINLLAWRIAQLIILTFALILVYKVFRRHNERRNIEKKVRG